MKLCFLSIKIIEFSKKSYVIWNKLIVISVGAGGNDEYDGGLFQVG